MIINIDNLPSRTLTHNEINYLWASGTDYLGMAHNTVLKQHLQTGTEHYGLHFGSSRNNTLQLAIYPQAEQLLATWIGSEGCLTTSSGMLAGQCVVQWLAQQANTNFVYLPNTHPALWLGGKEQSTCSTWQYISAIIKQIAFSSSHTVILADSVGSPYIEQHSFDWVADLPDNKAITLVIDDSHGLGILGENGRGIFATIQKKENIRLMIVASLNKGMGIPAGAIFADNDTLNKLRHFPFFSGSSPAVPAYLYAFVHTFQENIYAQQYQKLMANVAYIAPKINDTKLFNSIEGYPVFCSRMADLHTFLKEHHVLTACFSYPTPHDIPVLRLVINASHTVQDLDSIIANLCLYKR